MTSAPTDRYAVLGHPVAHSKSPFIHALFAKQTGQQLSYAAIDVTPGTFADVVTDFFAQGGAGLNVTVPYKEEAWRLAQLRSETAGVAGAVNTLYKNSAGKLFGDNTDGIGIVRDIVQNNAGNIEGKHLLLLGAGGAVRGVLPALLDENPASVTIVNRTLNKAEVLAHLFADRIAIVACDYETSGRELAKSNSGKAFDLVINGTSAGLSSATPPIPDCIVDNHTWCYDMMYGVGDTTFQKWAKQRNVAKAMNGSGMLVEQAAESFYLWRSVKPDTAPVLEKLRQELAR